MGKRSVLVAAAAVLLALGGPVGAVRVNCRKICRSDIMTCIGTAKASAGCKSLHGTDRAQCNKRLRGAVKGCRTTALAACSASGGTTCR